MAEPRVYPNLKLSSGDFNLREHQAFEPICDFRIMSRNISMTQRQIDGQYVIDTEYASPTTYNDLSIPLRAFDSPEYCFAGLASQLETLGVESYASEILNYAFNYGITSGFRRGFTIYAVFAMVTFSVVDEIVGVSDGDSGQRGASESAIRVLKKEEINGGGDDVCAICLDGFSAARAVARLPCSHVFDYDCVIRWLRRNNSCPCCRYTIDE